MFSATSVSQAAPQVLSCPDIVYNIIIQLSGSSESTYGAYEDGRLQELVSASQVNRIWRSVALSITSVWAEVYDPRDPSLERFLEIGQRTGRAPLRLTGRVPVDTHESEVEEADGTITENVEIYTMSTPQWRYYIEMSRLEEIDITFDHDDTLFYSDLDLLAEALKSPAPLLERLSISMEPHTRADFCMDGEGRTLGRNLIFSSEWLSGNAPRLHHLTMGNFFLHVKREALSLGLMRAFDNLISFKLDCPGRIQILFLMTWWMYLTRFTTFNPGSRLEHIDIGYVDGTVNHHVLNSVDDSSSPGVLPPSLKSFRLRGYILPCVWMLGNIELPPSCVIDLEFEVNVYWFMEGTDLHWMHEHVLDDLATHLSKHLTSDNLAELTVDISLGKFRLHLITVSGKHITLTVLLSSTDPDGTSELESVRASSDILGKLAALQSFPRGITSETWLNLSIVCEEDSVNVLANSLHAFMRKFSALHNLHLVRFPSSPFRTTLSPTEEPAEPATLLNFFKFEKIENSVFPLLEKLALEREVLQSRLFYDAHDAFFEKIKNSGRAVHELRGSRQVTGSTKHV